jgi:hypothetical protein
MTPKDQAHESEKQNRSLPAHCGTMNELPLHFNPDLRDSQVAIDLKIHGAARNLAR